MKYKKKNLEIVKYKDVYNKNKPFYGVDYITPGVGKTLKVFPTIKLAKIYRNKLIK